MKKRLPWIIVGLCALGTLAALRLPPDKPGQMAAREFGRLPVVSSGRVQPIDSLARNALLQLREKQRANLEPWKNWWQGPRILPATEWLLTLMMKPETADAWPVIRIDNPDLKGLLGLPADPDPAKGIDGKHYSWNQVQVKFADLEREAARASQKEAAQRDAYDRSVVKLWQNVALYRRLRRTFEPLADGELAKAQAEFATKLAAGRAAWDARTQGRSFDPAAARWFNEQFDAPLVVPPADPQGNRDDWQPIAAAMVHGAHGGPVPFAVSAYARMLGAYRQGNAEAFNQSLADYWGQLSAPFAAALKKARWEQFFNHFEPFYKALVLFVVAALAALGFWIRPEQWEWMRRTAVGLAGLALVVHTAGLLFRMLLEGRPPVTNLYSSAIFIGWAAVVLGLVLERFWRNGIGVVASSTVGFVTLIIAHHLSLTGDTMEMMRAVLDTNFWLAVHVVTVTLGYSATFLAGFLAIVYILRGFFTRALGPSVEQSLNRMVYGIICFAALFSFVGTVTGGIWADQSWGRFWGWDPKENGALIIVLWNALILHARWDGMVQERGLMNMAIVGNIVTAWSWFGVNMLGVGLHSYGFMDSAFVALVAFVGSQLALLALGLVPKHHWRSFAPASPSRPPEPESPLASAATARN